MPTTRSKRRADPPQPSEPAEEDGESCNVCMSRPLHNANEVCHSIGLQLSCSAHASSGFTRMQPPTTSMGPHGTRVQADLVVPSVSLWSLYKVSSEGVRAVLHITLRVL